MKHLLTALLTLSICTSCSEKNGTEKAQAEPNGKASAHDHTSGTSQPRSVRAATREARFQALMEKSSQQDLSFDYVQEIGDTLAGIDRPLSEAEVQQVQGMLAAVEQHSPRYAEAIVRRVDLNSDHYPEPLKHYMLTLVRPPVEQFKLSLTALQSEPYLDDILEKSLTRVEAEDIPLIIERLYDETDRGPEFNSLVLRKLFKSKGITLDDLNHAASSLMELRPELVPDAMRGFYNKLDKLVEDNKMTPAEAELIKSIMN